jgi:predicted ATP-binding protein involved in virulence
MGQPLSWVREKLSDRGYTKYGGALPIRNAAHRAVEDLRAGKDVVLPLLSFYGTERLWVLPDKDNRPRKRKKVPATELSRLRGYLNSTGFTIDEDALFDWIEKETLIGLQEGQESPLFRTVKRAISGCIENARDLYYDVKTEDVVVVMDNQPSQPFFNLSDGQRIMLTMVGDLAMKAATLNPHLGESALEATPGIVTIDELDLHLHPRWQRHVIRDLRKTFPAIQFITTTHSPQLIGEVEPREIVLLDGNITDNPPQSYGMDSNWVLKHLMGAEERDQGIDAAITEVENLILSRNFRKAEAQLDSLRSRIGNHPVLVRLAARLDRLAGASV